MTNLLRILVVILLITAMCSCGRRHEPDPNIPHALQDHSSKSDYSLELKSSRSGSSDLVNELFDELAEKIPDLGVIRERQLSLINQMQKEGEALIAPDYKSTKYYSDARAHAGSIRDSVDAAHWSGAIHSSEGKWHDRMKARDAAASQLNEKRQELIDGLHALKIRITLPQIEDYQKRTAPRLDSAQKLLTEAEALLTRMGKF